MNWTVHLKIWKREEIPVLFLENFKSKEPFFQFSLDRGNNDIEEFYVNDPSFAYLFGFCNFEDIPPPLVKLQKDGIVEPEYREADYKLSLILQKQYCYGFQLGKKEYKNEIEKTIKGNIGFKLTNKVKLKALPNLLEQWKAKGCFSSPLDAEKLREKGKFQAFYWLGWQDLNNNPITGFAKNKKEEDAEEIPTKPIDNELKSYISNGKEVQFLNLERVLIQGSYLNSIDYKFKFKVQIIAFAFILEEKSIIEVSSYPKFESLFAERYLEKLENEFTPVRKAKKSTQTHIKNLKSCFRSFGLTGFETSD